MYKIISRVENNFYETLNLKKLIAILIDNIFRKYIFKIFIFTFTYLKLLWILHILFILVF